MIARWFGAVLVAAALVACGGNGKPASLDVPADLPDLGDVPVVHFDYGSDTGPDDPGPRDETPIDDGAVAPDDDATPDAPPGDLGPDVVDPGPCVPDCTNRQCGSDGCSDVCGYCQQGYLCTVDGQCAVFCRPQCDGKICGPDGCQGYCAPGCADNEDCGPTGDTCVLKNCVKKCDGKVCGPDSCGGDCGTCPEGNLCTLDGQCTVDTACHDVTAVGRCVGNERQWCLDSVLTKETCDTASGFVCGYDAVGKDYICRKPEVCQPQCTNKGCGPDGCTGTCGTCVGPQVCSTGGQCGDACNGVTSAGRCIGDFTLEFCFQGILLQYDCYAANPPVGCNWNPEQQAFDCFAP